MVIIKEITWYIINFSVLIISLISIIYTLSHQGKRLKKLLKEMRYLLNRSNISVLKTIVIQEIRKATFRSLFYLDSRKKWITILFFFSLSSLTFLSRFAYKLDTPVGKTVVTVLAIIMFYCLGEMIHSPIGGSLIIDVVLKIIIILILIFALFQAYLNNFNGKTLFSTIIVSVSYMIIFLKYVIDNIRSLFIQFISFIIIIAINIIIISYSFGVYYFFNNEVYSFYDEEEMDLVNWSDFLWNCFVMYKGITPFFQYPKICFGEDFLYYVPLIEYFLGYIFNLTVIAIFVSYSVSKYFEKKSAKG